jgi:tRNA 2-selenouridine synthase
MSETIGIDEALAGLDRFDAVIDVRSESEFAEDRLPAAINLPVLDDTERAEVGTLYKQVSPFAARRRGAALVSRNIAAHLETALAAYGREWRPLIYCWRGGQRSGAMTLVLNRIGWQARQLDGGYRAFRRAVLTALDDLPGRFRFRVVCGPTGSGKSKLLRHLHEAGAQVLDLEALARHRGSVLGGLPAEPQPSQKMFETQIWQRLRGFDPAQPVFAESESRKVGDLRIPEKLMQTIRAADCLNLTLPQPERVRLLRDEYLHFERQPERLTLQLDCLKALHGAERIARWKQLAHEARWDELVDELLREHYDPAYQRSMHRNFQRLGQALELAPENGTDAAFSRLAHELALDAAATAATSPPPCPARSSARA